METRRLLTTFNVDTALDVEDASDGVTSLREAIVAANATSGADEITFDSSLAQINLTDGELLVSESISIIGPGANQLTIRSNFLSRIFHFDTIGPNDFSVSGLTLENGREENGGAIRVSGADNALTVSASILMDNQASGNGGGIAIENGASATIRDTAIIDNASDFDGAAVYVTDSFAVDGSNVLIINSTISGNKPGFQDGDLTYAAIAAESSASSAADLTIVSSTIADNEGTGVRTVAAGSQNASVDVSSTLLARNIGGNLSTVSDGSSISLLRSLGNNLSDDATAFSNSADDMLSTFPWLGPLADNGGLTPTHALQPSSPAIDAGQFRDDLATDQRGSGFTRLIDGNLDGTAVIDIGAYETSEPFAGTLQVSTISDVVDGDHSPGELSLREAVNAANQRLGSDTISFANSLINQTISLAEGEFPLTDSLSIDGLAANVLTIDANQQSRLFFVPNRLTYLEVRIAGLTLTGGRVSGAGNDGSGAAILMANAGELTIRDTVISNNLAEQTGGAIHADNGAFIDIQSSDFLGNEALIGGALYVFGGDTILTATDAIFRDNRASSGGAIAATIASDSYLTDVLFDANRATDTTDAGGGIYVDQAAVTVENSQFVSNTGVGPGGAIRIGDGSDLFELNVTDTAFVNNSTSDNGGAISSFSQADDDEVQVLNSTFSNNRAAGSGGAVFASGMLEIRTSTFAENLADTNIDGTGTGGALAVENVNAPLLYNSLLIGNQANGVLNDVSGTLTAGSSYNLVGTTSPSANGGLTHGTNGNIVGEAAAGGTRGVVSDISTIVGPLTTAGTTQVYPLVFAGAAVDSGDPSFIRAETLLDQRGTGFPRVADGGVADRIDIGAFELDVTFDFGDAPTTFPVVRPNGAGHVIDDIFLGESVDSESDGAPSAGSDADEDNGVVQGSTFIAVGGVDTSASVAVTASQSAHLDAWIDLNLDGDWDDPGEQIANAYAVNPGVNTLQFTIPGTALPGDAAARFRISADGGLPTTGFAVGGEVEDYTFTILDGDTPQDVDFALFETAARIIAENNRIVVRSPSGDLFSVPATSVNKLSVTADGQTSSITLDLIGGSITPAGGLSIDGGGGTNVLQITGGDGAFDASAGGNAAFVNFDSILLTGTGAIALTLDAPAIAALSSTSTPSVSGDADDSFVVSDAGDWRMGDPIFLNSRFLRTLTNTTNDVSINVDLPREWHNLVNGLDVNNSGGPLTPLDALLVINELAERARQGISDALVTPTTLADFPGVYYDTTDDGTLTPRDVLLVLNALAEAARNGPVGEAIDILSQRAASAEETSPADETQPLADSKQRVASFDFLTSTSQTDQHTASPILTTEDQADYANAVDELLAEWLKI